MKTQRVPTNSTLSKRHSLRGFTLIELLVSIAIIGILVSLTLPAVQAARESARRTECKNHLKEIGLAVHNHHDQYRYFPSGGWRFDTPPSYTNGGPDVGEIQRAGWAFQILTFLESTAVWQSGPAVAIATPNTNYFCPSRRSAQKVTTSDFYVPPVVPPGTQVEHALCDYAASNRQQTGAIRQFKPLRFRDMTDGTSSTLLIAEKRLNVGRLGSAQDDDNEGYTAGWNEDTVRRTDKPPMADYVGTGDGDKLFGSSHPGGMNSLFVDGSVRFISFNIDRNVFEAIGTRAGNEAIGEF